MTREQLKTAALTGDVDVSVEEIRTLFKSGKAAREWAEENGLRLSTFKGGVTVRAK